MNIFRFIVPKSMTETLSADASVRQAMEKMRYHRYTALPVIDGEGRYVGTVQNDDIFQYYMETGAYGSGRAERDRVVDIMSDRQPKPLYHTASMQDLFEEVKEHNFVSVVDDRGCFIGIILRREILNFLLRYYSESEGTDGAVVER